MYDNYFFLSTFSLNLARVALHVRTSDDIAGAVDELVETVNKMMPGELDWLLPPIEAPTQH